MKSKDSDIAVSPEVFHSEILKLERMHNAGSTAAYDNEKNTTNWFIAGKKVGVSSGVLGTKENYWLEAH